jgi:L-amino acid N-acyltransferase YncA
MEKKPDMQIIAEIKSGNLSSIKAFQNAGFKESHVTYIFELQKGRLI